MGYQMTKIQRPVDGQLLKDWNDFNALNLYVKGDLPIPRCVRVEDGWTRLSIHMTPQTLFPTEEMMQDFEKFIAFAWWLGAGFPGICRVIPYEGYCPNASKYEDANDRVNFQDPLKQFVRYEKDLGDLFVLDFLPVKTKYNLQTFFQYTQATYVTIHYMEMLKVVMRSSHRLYIGNAGTQPQKRKAGSSGNGSGKM
jgi:hypothetical protein